MPIVSAYAIFDGTTSTYVGDENATVQINCERVQAFSPRPVWLKRFQAPGQGMYILYELTFDANDPEIDDNTLQGFWVNQDGKDVMIDAADATAFTTACDACCDDQPITVTRYYTSGIPSYTVPTLSTYCIERENDGSARAHEDVSLAYLTQYVGNVIAISHDTGTGVSQYQVEAFSEPTAIGDDTVSAGACA